MPNQVITNKKNIEKIAQRANDLTDGFEQMRKVVGEQTSYIQGLEAELRHHGYVFVGMLTMLYRLIDSGSILVPEGKKEEILAYITDDKLLGVTDDAIKMTSFIAVLDTLMLIDETSAGAAPVFEYGGG